MCTRGGAHGPPLSPLLLPFPLLTRSYYVALAVLNSLHWLSWPQIHRDLLASVCPVLVIKASAAMPGVSFNGTINPLVNCSFYFGLTQLQLKGKWVEYIRLG